MAENYTTITQDDVTTYGVDSELVGKTVSASEYKKLTGMDKNTDGGIKVSEGNKGVAEATVDSETTADESAEPKKSTAKKTAQKGSK